MFIIELTYTADLARIRAFVLRVTREVVRKLEHRDDRFRDNAVSFECR